MFFQVDIVTVLFLAWNECEFVSGYGTTTDGRSPIDHRTKQLLLIELNTPEFGKTKLEYNFYLS